MASRLHPPPLPGWRGARSCAAAGGAGPPPDRPAGPEGGSGIRCRRWYRCWSRARHPRTAGRINKLASPASANTYAYAADNPANYIDPTGQWSWNSFGWALLEGGVTTAVGGCVAGAVATIWTGPGAVVGCVAGFAAGGMGGLVTGGLVNIWSQENWGS